MVNQMKFLIDKSPPDVKRKAVSPLVAGQLLTPLTRYRNWGGKYGVDNGAYSGFDEVAFAKLLKREEARKAACLFVTCPDIVGSAQRSIELFKRRRLWIPEGWPVALVVQDGMENLEIPWDEIAAIFVGGCDPWKDSKCAQDIVKTAKILNKWSHVGRVNTPKRFELFADLGADTCDGSGVAMYDHMLAKIEKHMSGDGDPTLFDMSGKDAATGTRCEAGRMPALC